MKNKMIFTAICASILSVVGLTLPAMAEEITPRDLTSSVRSEETESTFELEQSDSDTEILKVGHNRFIAGMNVMSETETNGLLFISGNNVGVKLLPSMPLWLETFWTFHLLLRKICLL